MSGNGGKDWLSVDFRAQGDASRFLKGGWSFQEPNGIWAIGTESALVLPAAPDTGRHRLELIVWSPAGAPQHDERRLAIVVNGKEIFSGTPRHRTPGPVECVIPDALLRTDRDNELTLRHPDAISPATFSSFVPARRDGRQLGTFVVRLRVESLGDRPAVAPPAPDAVRSAGRKLILCHWSRVAHHIGCALEAFPPFEDVFELRFVRSDTPWQATLAALPDEDRARVVALWEEVAQAGPAAARPAALAEFPRVRFPKLAIECLWPLRGHDPRLRPEPPLYPDGRYPYTDRAAVRLAGQALPDDTLYERYCALSEQLMPDLAGVLAGDVERWRALDACCDVRVAEFILENFRSVPLFHAPDVPAGPLLRYVVERLLGTLLAHIPGFPSDLYDAFARYIEGYQGLLFDQAPVHPLVVERLGISCLAPDRCYRRGHSQRDFREHTLDYIRWAPWFAGRNGRGEAELLNVKDVGGAGAAARRATAKPILLIYANCQGAHIANLLLRIKPLADQVAVKFLFFHTLEEPGQGWDTYPEDCLAGVTWVWEQVSEAFPAARAELHRRLPQGARRIRFPVLTAGMMWPFHAPDPRPSKRQLYLYGDSIAAQLGVRLADKRVTDDEILAEYMELSVGSMPDLNRRLDVENWMWRNRDRNADVVVADYLFDNFRRCRLFHEAALPAGDPVRHVTRQLLDATLDASWSESATIVGAADELFRGYLGYDTFSPPIHPVVAERLRLEWFDPAARYRWFMHDWTFEEWVVRCVRLAPYVNTLF